ncbi:hypothetical protein [Streptomyces sp. NPDC058412]
MEIEAGERSGAFHADRDSITYVGAGVSWKRALGARLFRRKR